MTVALGQIILHGLHVWQIPDNGGKKDVTEPASYPIDWPSLASGANKLVPIILDGDKDFMLTHITHAQTDSGFIPLKVQITENSGKTLFVQPAYINAVSSINAGQPFVLAQKKLYRRSAVIKATFAVD